jgi:3-oxoacyl-[acyl-carrier protein] reductase
MEQQLFGKTALVTGGGRGIGRAISLALARAGADVAVNYRERRDDADSAVSEIRNMGRRATAIQADVSRGAEVGELARAVESQLGPIEILANNAGKILIQSVEQMREEDWNEMIAVN